MDQAVRTQLARILASDGFREAGRLGAFLRFVVEEALRGEAGRLKESVIGVEVFQRAPDYDPRIDPIVRVEARRLRARLDDYYAGAGAGDRVRIRLPKGTYAPVFEGKGEGESTPVQKPRRWMWWIPAALGVMMLLVASAWLWMGGSRSPAEDVRLLVLPFTNLSEDAANEYFSQGLTEELIDALSQVDGLRVVARSIAFQYRGKSIDVRELGRSLDVTAVVEGSVRKSGDNLRITAQLINARDGFQQWSQTWDRKMADVFAVQEELGRAIASRLKVQLRVDTRGSLSRRYRGNVDAYNLYLQGRHALSRFDKEGVKQALGSFEAACSLDPGFAPGYAGMSYVFAFLAYYDEDNARQWFEKARAAAEKAIALDERLSEAHAALGFVKGFHEWDWAGAEKEFARALELNPHSADAHSWYAAAVLLPRGELERANREFARALELDPQAPATSFIAAFTLLASGRIEEALKMYERTLALRNQHPDVAWDYGMALGFAGRVKEAERQFRSAGAMGAEPGQPWGVLELYFLGRKEEARALLPRVEKEAAGGGVSAMEAARCLAMLGETEKALRWLEEAYRRRERQVIWLKVDPRLKSLRGSARHAALVRKMGLPPD